jgi:hypothetical protein
MAASATDTRGWRTTSVMRRCRTALTRRPRVLLALRPRQAARREQGVQSASRATNTSRWVNAFSCRVSDCHSATPCGQRNVPSPCGTKDSAPSRPARARAHSSGPYSGSSPGAGSATLSDEPVCEGAHSISRSGVSLHLVEKANRRFQTHCQMMCQNSWPPGVREHQRSGSPSRSSSASVPSNAPRP